MRNRFRPLVLSVLLLGMSTGGAAAQFSVQPVIIEMSGPQGSTATIAIRNEGTQELQMRLYTGDFDQDIGGGHTFAEPGTLPSSCGGSIEVFPEAVLVPPGETREARLSMSDVDRTCWSIVFVESTAPNQTGMVVAQRIGVKVYGIDSAASRDGEIEAVTVEEGPELVLGLTFRNLGTRPTRPEGEVEIRSVEGEVVAVVPVEPFSVLPGHDRRVRIPLSVELGPGLYLAVPILDFGADFLVGGQATFEVPDP